MPNDLVMLLIEGPTIHTLLINAKPLYPTDAGEELLVVGIPAGCGKVFSVGEGRRKVQRWWN